MAATAVSPARRAGMPRMLDGNSSSSKFKQRIERPIAPKPSTQRNMSNSPRRDKDDHHHPSSQRRPQLANGHHVTATNGVTKEHRDSSEEEEEDDNDKGEGTSANGPVNIMKKLGSAGNGMFDVAALLKEPLKFVPAKHADEGSQKLPYEPLPTGPLAPASVQTNGVPASSLKGKGPALLNGTGTAVADQTSSPAAASISSNRPADTSVGGASSSSTKATSASVHAVPLPKSWPQNFPVGPGYHNLGNTCFLNSTLQSLTHTAPLVACLMGEGYHSPKACKLTQNNKFCLLCAMQQHIRSCFGKNRNTGAFAPNSIVRRLTLFAKGMHVGRQEDAHEFLRFSLDAMQQSAAVNAIPPAKTEAQKEMTFMHRIFGGKLRSRVTCMSCKHNSDTFDSFMDLSLDVSRADSLREAFQAFVKVDMLQGANKYKCEKCKKLVVARKQFTINKAPQILHVHLKRFTPTGRKIVGHITYHEHMSLKEYMSEESEDSPNYRLYAVVCHSGQGPHSGHYFAHVRSGNNKWHCMNDSSVSEVQTSIACNQRNAYLLFYERINRLGDAVGRTEVSGGQSKDVAQTVDAASSVTGTNGKRKERDEESTSFPQQRIKLQNQSSHQSFGKSDSPNRKIQPSAMSGPASPLRQHTNHFSQGQTSPTSPKPKKTQLGLFTQTGPVLKNPQFNRGHAGIPTPAFFSTANNRKPRRKSLHANMNPRPRN